MEPNTNGGTNPTGGGNSMTWIAAVVVVVILLLAGGGYWYLSRDNITAVTDNSKSAPTIPPQTMSDNDGDEDDMVTASTAPSTQSATTSANAEVAGGVQTVTVDGSNFKFVPNSITVKKGSPVKITFNNTQGFHDFVAPDLNVKTNQITAGNSATVEFTPTKAGSFEFYCSVGNHKNMGMKGTIVVQ